MVDELCRLSPEFAEIWALNDVRIDKGELVKTVLHPLAGRLRLEHSSFTVQGRPELEMVVYNPATPEDARRLRALVEAPLSETAG
eukprot:gene40242-biopygen32115